jgi:hypothetical protein
MKNFSLIIVLSLFLTGCYEGQLNMPLSYAKIDRGYLNSSSHNLGKIYLWDTQTNQLHSLKFIKPDQDDNNATKTYIGSRHEQKIAKVDKNTKIDITGTGIPKEISGKAKIEFAKATNVFIKDYQLKAFEDPRYLLNSKHLRTWRESLARDGYLDNDRYKFVLINEVIEGRQALIDLDNNLTVDAGVNVIKIGKYDFETTYNNNKHEEIRGKEDVPLIIIVTVFDLKSDPEQTKYEGLRFSISNNPKHKFDYQSI